MITNSRPARRARTRATTLKVESVEPESHSVSAVKDELSDECAHMLVEESRDEPMSPPTSVGHPPSPTADPDPQPIGSTDAPTPGDGVDDGGAEDDADHLADVDEEQIDEKPKQKGRRTQTRAAREAQLAARASKDAAFNKVFDPSKDWLPPGTTPEDYTTEFCQKLERQFWRNCSLGRPAWYGADTQGKFSFSLDRWIYMTQSRFVVFRRDENLECGASPIFPRSYPSIIFQGSSGCKYALLVLWHVESDICLARRRYGSFQHQLYSLRRSQVLVCNTPGACNSS